MNRANILVGGIKIGLVVVIWASLAGCVGYVDGGGGGGAVVVDGPGYFDGGFGGFYDERRSVRGYSGRGSASRAAAHSGGGGSHGGKR
jgi:hypothetical protein